MQYVYFIAAHYNYRGENSMFTDVLILNRRIKKLDDLEKLRKSIAEVEKIDKQSLVIFNYKLLGVKLFSKVDVQL